ncbi:hypothetical protein ARMGADRAFT_1073823 [Armillaria gallica]|uniref:Uncharacterized protein n=1 Tax=Armillaria gallica TaxID=47427 RepID=A0A2H3E591_ARMGA|nr:hypothetical protein ARMGADRAFT_1073823 [Armillaria gallica]
MSLKSGIDILPYAVTVNVQYEYHYHDDKLNATIELALLHGIYTGIVSVTLWNIFISKSRSIGRAMVAVIILLYVTTSINVFLNSALILSVETTVVDGLELDPSTNRLNGISNLGIGMTAVMSTAIADSTIIWRCWMVWGRRWSIVVFPVLCLIGGVALKIRDISEVFLHGNGDQLILVIYIFCIFATTTWCTVLIVFRIVTVIRVNDAANSRLGDYSHVIEVLVESSALHSVVLLVFVGLEANDSFLSDYFDTLAAVTTGVAPTLLAGRIAAGHARPDGSWEGSIMSSLRFEAHQPANPETSSQENSMSDSDLEAQSSQVDEPEEISAGKRM